MFECQRSVVLGLFEDIHRAYDGLPPRKRGQTYFDDGPYLGARYQQTSTPQILLDHQGMINQDSMGSS